MLARSAGDQAGSEDANPGAGTVGQRDLEYRGQDAAHRNGSQFRSSPIAENAVRIDDQPGPGRAVA